MILKLEQKIIVEECGMCSKELKIPIEIYERIESKRRNRKINSERNSRMLGKQHGSFYISPNGYYYCNNKCFQLYTED